MGVIAQQVAALALWLQQQESPLFQLPNYVSLESGLQKYL